MDKYNLLEGIPFRGKLLEELNLYCAVKPLARPRKGNGGNFFTPRINQLALFKEINWYFQGTKRYKTIDYPVIIDYFIYFRDESAEFPISNNYGDLDNLNKAVNDALSPHKNILDKKLIHDKILHDDRLIIGGESWKLFDRETQNETDDFAVIRIYKPTWEEE